MKKLIVLCSLFSFSACSTTYYRDETAETVDMNRFMGKWYVIAHIPTFLEKGAFNATETYSLKKNGKIDIDFRFNKDGFDGELKKVPQTGWVFDEKTKAHWKVRPFWPLKFDYLVHYVSDNHDVTMIGVPKHNYLWFMSKTPELDSVERAKMEEMAEALGYDLNELIEIPQKWN